MERASIFDENADFDVSDFAPRKPRVDAPKEKVRQVSEASAFRSREPSEPKRASREPRVHRTGRNVQLNIKVSAETMESFYQLADRQGWVLGETMERAIEALKKELAG